ncbi:unnamed protein product, partial [Discosporangium mesarthrocarpum]
RGSEEEAVSSLRICLARLRLAEDRTLRAELRSALGGLGEASASMPGYILPSPARDVLALASEARTNVLGVCIAPVRSWLSAIPSMPSWDQGGARG